MAVVKKAAVAIYSGIHAFTKNSRNFMLIDILVQLRPPRSLQAVIGPKRLATAFPFNNSKNLFPRMLRSKTFMTRRVPVLRSHNQVILPLQVVDYRYERISPGHRQGTPGKKSYCISTMIRHFMVFRLKRKDSYFRF